MLLSDHSWKTNLELIMEVRSLWADVNLRMPILLHVTICISWIEGLHNKCISLCIMISKGVVKPTVNSKFKSQILWKSSTELKINIPYWNLHDYLWAESGSLKHCKIDEPCCQLHLPKNARFYWHALNHLNEKTRSIPVEEWCVPQVEVSEYQNHPSEAPLEQKGCASYWDWLFEDMHTNSVTSLTLVHLCLMYETLLLWTATYHIRKIS